MRNIDWLCENDREQLMKLLAEGDSCEYCALEIEDDCDMRCNEGVRAWLEAEHNDGLKLENGVSAEDADANDGKPDIDTREKLEADVYRVADEMDAFYCGERFLDTRKIIGWLDRQAAITEREIAEKNLGKWHEWCEELGIECTKERAGEKIAEMQERIRQLEAELRECDEQRIEYRDQRDWYRDRLGEFRKKLGDAVWHAQAIARITEVDA